MRKKKLLNSRNKSFNANLNQEYFLLFLILKLYCTKKSRFLIFRIYYLTNLLLINNFSYKYFYQISTAFCKHIFKNLTHMSLTSEQCRK